MKRFLPFIAIAALLASCTLSMEDWVTPEEEKGFDEPETVENEFGSVTYQFKDGVRSITENIQEYIIEVEDDSVLYFMDNTPDEWLPRVGDKLAAMCSPVLPFGLNHQVIDVRDVGGIWKVTCTSASRDDIYESLVIDLDYEVATPDIPVYDSLYLDSLGIKGEDLIIEDLSLLEDYYGTEAMVKAKKPRRAYRKTAAWKRTRAALGIESEILATRGEKSTDSVMHWKFTDLSYTDKSTGIKFSLGGEVEKHSVQKIVYYEDKEKDYKKQITTDKSYDIWKISASMSTSKDVFDAHDDQTIEKLSQLKKALKNLKPEKSKGKKTMVGGKILWPIPAMPAISLKIGIEGNVTFEGAICADLEIEHRHPVTESGYEYKDGTKEYIPTTKINEGYTKPKNFSGYGSITVSAQVRASVGIEITGTGVGGDVGLGITAKVTGKLPIPDIQQLTKDETTSFIEDTPSLTFESYFFVDASIYFSPGGFNIFTASKELLKKTIFTSPLYPLPAVDKDKSTHTYTIEQDNEAGTRNNKYKMAVVFKRFWLLWPPSDDCHVRLRAYIGGYGKEFYDIREDDHIYSETPLKKDYSYNFTHYIETGKYDKIIFVPCIYDPKHHHCYEFRESAMTFGDAQPSFKYVKQKSRVSLSLPKYFDEEINDEDAQKDFLKEYGINKLPGTLKDPAKWYFHEFAIAFEIKNMGMVDHWGTKVKVATFYAYGDGTKLLETDIDVKKRNTYLKAGKKTLVYSFVTNWSKGHEITITPYTVDAGGKKTYYEKAFGPYSIEEDHYNSSWNWKDWPGAMIQADIIAGSSE